MLILPKKHFHDVDDLDEATAYHMHVFPRYEFDGFGWLEPVDSKNAKGRLKETAAALVALLDQQLLS